MRSSDFVNHSYDYRPNWTPLSPVTITYFPQMSADPGLHFYPGFVFFCSNAFSPIIFSSLVTEHPPINKIVDKKN